MSCAARRAYVRRVVLLKLSAGALMQAVKMAAPAAGDGSDEAALTDEEVRRFVRDGCAHGNRSRGPAPR